MCISHQEVCWIHAFKLKNQGFWDIPPTPNMSGCCWYITQINIASLSNVDDKLVWRANDGRLCGFSVSLAWDTVRPRGNEVKYHDDFGSTDLQNFATVEAYFCRVGLDDSRVSRHIGKYDILRQYRRVLLQTEAQAILVGPNRSLSTKQGCLGGVGVGPIEVGLGKILHVQKIVDSYQFPFDEMIKVVSAVSSLLLRPPAPVSFSGQVKPASQDVLEIYMQQFWFTINKKDSTTYKFKIDKKSYRIDMEVFREIFQICPRLPNKDFDELPSDDEFVSFIKELGHKVDIKSITEVVVDQMYQPWRTFAAIINTCLYRKITGLDMLRLSRAQILWGMFYKKNVGFVELLWEDSRKLSFIISSPKTIYGALLPKRMTNQQMQDSDAYKTYLAYATGAASPKMKRKIKKLASPSKKRSFVTIEEEEPEPAKKAVSSKKPDAKRYEGADFELEVPDEPKGKSIDTSEGTGLKPGVPDVSTANSSDSENESWGDSGDEANEQGDDEDDQQSDDERTESDDEQTEADNPKTSDDEYVHTPEDYVPTDDETNDESKEFDKEEYEELYGDVKISLKDAEPADKEKDDEEMTVVGHVNVNQEDGGNLVKDDAQATQKTKVPIPSSSISSDYAVKYLNFDNIPPVDTEVVSMLDINVQH
ncbi:hypothetical protein Tco_0657157 [Tanacetum coccineum]|uniref:Uncharacterized protein n=1 Tax=Tanacetum coccineum TaxID=301880 RepID=A0ABQ4XBI8_9ASTR